MRCHRRIGLPNGSELYHETAHQEAGDCDGWRNIAITLADFPASVQKLPPPYRMVLVLRDMEGLSDREVGEVTGLRAGTVRVRLHRARLFVRREVLKTVAATPAARRATVSPRPRSCKALFAELSDYLDETLDDSLCEELEKHLEGCQACRAFLSTLEATIEQCRQAPAECPNSRQAASLREQLLTEYRRIATLARPRAKG